MVPQHWIGRTIALLLAFNPALAWAHSQDSQESPRTGGAEAAERSTAEPPESVAREMRREGSSPTRSAARAPASPLPAAPSWHPPAPAPALAPPPALDAKPPYYKIHVTGAGISEFYYLRQDLFIDLAATDALRARAVEQGKTFGPFPVGSFVPVRAGGNYVLLPVCTGQINWIARASVNLAFGQLQGEVALSCPH
jgi:hypothetical protein